MRPVGGTLRLEVEPELQQKLLGTGQWALYRGGSQGSKLGTWISPTRPKDLGQRPQDVWIPSFFVSDLPAPFAYRLVVNFRWLGSAGRVIATATHYSKMCREPERRPDLVIDSVTVQSGVNPLSDTFYVTLSNVGQTAAQRFDVRLTYTHATQTQLLSHTIYRLSPRSMTILRFAGPVCDSSTLVEATADPTGVVDVYTRSNSTTAATCP